ncbi:MAG: PilC/PilY family type IV pilus protein [Candidatus Aminicenantales bacterium]
MNKKNTRIWLAAGVCAGLALFGSGAWAQVTCNEQWAIFAENFDAVTYKDVQNSSVAGWPSGPITLSNLGANFAITEPAGMGGHVYVCDGGDFTGDGLPDLMGLDIENNFRLCLVRNQFNDANGDKVDDDGIVYRIDPTEIYEEGLTCGPATITVGDYNKDGLLDFFFMKNGSDSYSYNGFVAAMYINVGTATNPNFRAHNLSPNLDFTSRFQSSGIYLNWTADHVSSVDLDKDGDQDILVISQDKIFLMRNPGASNFNLNAWGIAEINYDLPTGFPIGADNQRGGSSIDAGDFDNDGDIDIIGGSVMNVPYLVYYENDGLGAFTRKEIAIPTASCTGTVATCVADFKNDGHLDIFGATDAWNAGNEAHMWLFKNEGFIEGTTEEDPGHVDWAFQCLNNCLPILPDPHDVDMSACIDYDQDGDMDVVLADANHSGNYYLIINELAPVYALTGVATSTNVTESLDPREYAITKVQFTSLRQRVIGGSSTGLIVTIEVSNNGGQVWEPYAEFTGSNIQNRTNLPVHNFNSFGGQLKWRAMLEAAEDPMAEYTGASYETPAIDDLEIKYWYVQRIEYSRSSASATIVDRSGTERKLIIGSSFIFPGWEGQLRAYDVTEMGLTGGEYSTLRTVTASDPGASSGRTTATGVEILWDAGQALNDRSPDDRTIYTALRSGTRSPYSWTRIDFTRDNVNSLRTLLNDQQNDNAGLIDFIRGEGRYWKLGDINHSSPVVVGPPDAEASVMGTGYAEFKEARKTRPKVLYVGANDGMLHCFSVSTGEELWGFIPYNLLSKLRNMRAVDAATHQRYYVHDYYVDGSPSVSDVYINGQWKTILICGQGAGYGSGPANYYFTLDITDPGNPQLLWTSTSSTALDITQANMGETWSVPAIGKINHSGTPRWVAFMGSGYDNLPIGSPTTNPVAGDRFYVVRLDTGAILQTVRKTDVNTNNNTIMSGWKNAYKYTNIVNAFPGSPTTVDTEHDGFVNSVYIGDLDGRLYRMDTTPSSPSSWGLQAIYTDALYYPIITKPEVWLDSLSGAEIPHVYFGTGGHETARADRTYSFVELIDNGASTAQVGWFLGNPVVLGNPAGQDVGDLDAGDKVWADPVFSDFIIYFSTLRGNIENANPCLNLAEPEGKLFARYVRSVAGVSVGGSAFKTAEATPQYLTMVSKARRAVTLGQRVNTPGVSKREVYIQEYDSTIEMLEQPVGSTLQIKSWREIYRIIR